MTPVTTPAAEQLWFQRGGANEMLESAIDRVREDRGDVPAYILSLSWNELCALLGVLLNEDVQQQLASNRQGHLPQLLARALTTQVVFASDAKSSCTARCVPLRFPEPSREEKEPLALEAPPSDR